MKPAASGGCLAAFATAIVVLAGCANSPPTVYYTLDPVPPAAAAAPAPAAAAPLRVDAVHLPPVLNQPEIYLRQGPNELRVDDFARWAAPLGEMMQRTLTQDLASRLPPGAVIYPGATPPSKVAGLTLDVLAFEVVDGQGRLSASWTSGVQPALQSRTLQLSTPVQGSGPRAVAEALSTLMGRVADDIAAHAGQGLAGN